MNNFKITGPGYYKGEFGTKIYVLGKDPFDEDNWVGTSEDHFHYLDNAGCELGSTSHENVVAVWKDPVKVSGYVNVYSDRTGPVHPTRAQANDNTGGSRIACVYVSGEEGVEP